MIHPSALVSSSAKVDEGVEIGPYSIVHENVWIKRDTKVGAYCEIGLPNPLAKKATLEIGEGNPQPYSNLLRFLDWAWAAYGTPRLHQGKL